MGAQQETNFLGEFCNWANAGDRRTEEMQSKFTGTAQVWLADLKAKT